MPVARQCEQRPSPPLPTLDARERCAHEVVACPAKKDWRERSQGFVREAHGQCPRDGIGREASCIR